MVNMFYLLFAYKRFIFIAIGYLFIIYVQSLINSINYYLLNQFNYEINNTHSISFLFNLKNVVPISIQSILYLILFGYNNLKLLFKTNIKYFVMTIIEKIKYHTIVHISFFISILTFYLTNFYKHEIINTYYFNWFVIITNISNLLSITICGGIWIILVKIAILSKIK